MRTPKILAVTLLGLALSGIAVAQQDEPPPIPDDQTQATPDGAPDPGPDAASVDYFYQPLAGYGQWTYRDGYGEVWVPKMEADWRPYTTGHWVYTDDGWAWVADEPWGWATFHYGRWYRDEEIGWAWVPGTVWAPAWVAWRNGNGYVGWAPLPPAVGFRFGVGIELGGVEIAPTHYCFVAENAILAPRIVTVVEPAARNITIINRTTNITNITVVNNRVVNTGVSVQHIEQVTGHPVQRLQIAATVSASAHGRVSGGQVAFYQPAAVVRAARSNHAEFGASLHTQVAAQAKSRYVGRQVATHTPVVTHTPTGTPPATVNVEALRQRHTNEKVQLSQQQTKEREDLSRQQQAELKAKGQSNELVKQHAAQLKAQQQAHQNQQHQLDLRHQQELQAAQKQKENKDKEHRPPA